MPAAQAVQQTQAIPSQVVKQPAVKPVEGGKKSMWWLWLIIVLVIIGIGTGIYFWLAQP